jgi:2-polyprenyl-3-methyl-5-hydroxy-6-metoxy-1,4-benzoquinol methylase
LKKWIFIKSYVHKILRFLANGTNFNRKFQKNKRLQAFTVASLFIQTGNLMEEQNAQLP